MGESTIAIRRDVLQSWLKVSGYTGTRLARELNVSKGRVSQILHSDQEPSARLIAGLLHVTDLPFDRLFAVKAHRAMLRRMRRLAQRRQRRLPRGEMARSSTTR